MSGELHTIGRRAFLRMLRHGDSRPPFLLIGVLTTLAAAAPRIVGMDELIANIWGGDPSGGPEWPENEIRITVMNLRAKGFLIENHHTRGYQFHGRRLPAPRAA